MLNQKILMVWLSKKEGFYLSRRRGIMSEQLKYEIARELGVDRVVANEGWGGVSSRDCGRMVATAIEIAEHSVAARNNQNLR
jgi:small acid-soluble spore protein F (minor alpha/beta-type SASP)